MNKRKVQSEKRKVKVRSLKFLVLSFSFALCALSFELVCYADNKIESSFYTANSFYVQADYDAAIKQYNSIIDNGWESGNLYYNLGNCFFKKGELGKALLNYEKARRLIPLDKDLESNYDYACSLIKGGAAVSKKSLPVKILNNFFDKFTVDGLTILLGAFYLLILISILISFLFKPLKKHALVPAVFMGSFLIIGFVGLREKTARLNKEAVVTAETADVRFEPMDKATAYFTLYEGMKVEVIASKDNWYKVKRPDNKSGWVENSAVAIF
ncbi:MAG: SH3 domain-containing protein [Candidatus Omnitrophota bacterium]